MKLFYIPGTCALAAHIAAREAGLELEAVKVEKVDGVKQADGRDYLSIAPKGKVPALLMDDGELLSETPAILQYLAVQAPGRSPFPRDGLAHWRMQELLHFIASELHRGFAPMFSALCAPEHKAAMQATVERNLGHLQEMLGDKPFLTGDAFSIADAYAFTVLRWRERFGIGLEPWPALADYVERIAARSAVRRAMAEEGLI